ncbi:DUF2585 family protein [Aquamicrobium zhengzhouense]|uniref:DUF2585 family protein n=1 Tax=Aquamicrobium zhengzhouense TaxID=2781738 RepID=A0ABS0SI25_9HYPH|nr:DUF2585 family protein [Aquamicrobium zhengzhouense]MBI1622376.1 DUF2585 family protein [Aquamicrobium zhengzhouense]
MSSSVALSRPATEAAFTIFAIILFKVLILHWIGRPLICECGVLKLWQGRLDPHHNSQHFSDHYSLLHAAFGIGLFRILVWLRPDWSMARLMVAVAASSAIWEVMENTPFIIERFAAFGSNLDYQGDSLVNSVGDTLFVLIGAFLAAWLRQMPALMLALCIELSVYLLIGDSIVHGMLRLVAGPTS